ncbi:MAG: PQQ-dependent sugar dehydrogenase, partial [Variovorax sp.]
MNLPRLSLLASLRLWTFVTVIGFCATAAAQMRPETLVTGLENPWGVAFLPGGRFVVTERPGRLRLIGADGKIGAPIAGLPPIAAGGQGG